MSKMNRAAALSVRKALDHHARGLRPIFQALQDALDWGEHMHRIESMMGGMNSNLLILGDGRYFELRGRDHNGSKPYIAATQIGHAPRSARVEVRLYDERDALRFVEAL